MISITRKLVVFTTSIILLVVLSLSAANIKLNRDRTLAEFQHHVTSLAMVTGEVAVSHVYNLDMLNLRKQIGSVSTNEGSKSALVLDEKGKILTDGTKENPLRGLKPAGAFVEELLSTGKWLTYIDSNELKIGGPILLGEHEVIGYVSFDFSLSELNAHMKDQIIQTILLSILFVILGLVAAVILARRFTHPIIQLNNAAVQISVGGRGEIPEYGNDEIGQLAASFSSMVSQQEKTQNDLRLLAGSLEEQVNERTKELQEREQDLMIAVEKTKSSERAKSEFLANMSHEIRTPMNGVLGMAELLSKTELDAKQSMFTDVIIKSGNSLLTIINDILDFSKIDAGQMTLDAAPFLLAEAVEDVATLVSSRVVEKDLELIVRIDPELKQMLVGDVGRIRQIITNLLGNAVKFTEKGHVYVNVTSIDGVDDPEDIKQRLRFSIEDTGVGIPKEDLEKVFDKFSQVDTSATRKHEGTGLGLSIASSLVQLMNGKMGVESVLGEGSTFWFEIELGVHGVEKPKNAPIDIIGSRILIIDDNEVNRSILMEQMASWGFDSAAATSGREGLAVLRSAIAQGISIGCIVLDYRMPEMNGGEVVMQLHDDAAISHIPILMLTSVNETQDGKSFASLGIQNHLTKPARSSLLLETIIELLQEDKLKNNNLELNPGSGIGPLNGSMQKVNNFAAIASQIKNDIALPVEQGNGNGADQEMKNQPEVKQIPSAGKSANMQVLASLQKGAIGEKIENKNKAISNLPPEVKLNEVPPLQSAIEGSVGIELEPEDKAVPYQKHVNGSLDTKMKKDQSIDVLVCEDNEVNQIVFVQILQETGFTYKVASNGLQGVDAYKNYSFSLILMDVSMPKMNGLEATQAIRKIEEETGRHIPVIGVTAHAMKGDREKCFDAGMDDYLSKPVSPDMLEKKINKWLTIKSRDVTIGEK